MSVIVAVLTRCCSRIRHLKRLEHCCKTFTDSSASKVRLCVVGSGPAGFYTAQALLKRQNVEVDIFEKLPVPFGLVRFGVAPDHPEVKNCISTFSNTASNPNCKFVGNVSIGKDITLAELRQAYNGIVLSYGADNDKKLGIPGETGNVVSARKFVGWYNGLPENCDLSINLDVETVVVIGLGNVAIDVARILLSPIDKLKGTDITEHAMETLSKSRVRRVVLVGRRGPLQVAFTIKELREMTKLEGCRSLLRLEDFQPFESIVSSLPRPRKRITELMIQTSKQAKDPNYTGKEWELKLLRTPLEVLVSGDSDKVKGVLVEVNSLSDDSIDAKVVGTGETETIECELVLRSIGYKSLNLDPSIPFDDSRGIIPNTQGKVMSSQGLYCSGWVKTGPVGVILSTMNSAFETASILLKDLEEGQLASNAKPGFEMICKLLQERDIQSVNFDDWKKIDHWEKEQGKKLDKARCKVLRIDEMLKITGAC